MLSGCFYLQLYMSGAHIKEPSLIKNITFHSLFLLALVSLLFLGFWQLQRLEWKVELLSSIKNGLSEGIVEFPFDINNSEFLYKNWCKNFCRNRIRFRRAQIRRKA